MAILDGMEVSVDDLISCSKLQSLFMVVVNKLNEQDAAIQQLREQAVLLGNVHSQVAAALQMCEDNSNGKERFEKRLSAMEEVTTRLPKAEAAIAQVEAGVQCLARELNQAEFRAEHRVASLENQVEHKIASLERKMEMQASMLEKKLDAEAEQSSTRTQQLVEEYVRRVETRLDRMEQRLRQVQAPVDLHVRPCSANDDTGPLLEEGKEEAEHIVIVSPKAAMTSMEPTIPVGLLFPGQGSQYVTMMNSVQDLPAVKTMLEKAKAILGWDVLELCLTGPPSKLQETKFFQPAMFIAGLAALEKLRQDRKEAAERFQVTAGLSLGEYTALCVAGVFSFEDGLKLVDIRGKAMQEAANICKQAMLSVAGLDKPMLEELCKQAQEREGGSAVCQISNELFPLGFCCAGTEPAIYHLQHISENAGALQAKILKTSGAFHTSLMAPAKEKIGRALDELLPKMNPPRHTVYMNATAEPIKPGTNPKEVVRLLKRGLTSPVKWESCMRAMIEGGVTVFYEVGPLKQIKAMMRRIDATVWSTTNNVEI